MTDGLLAVVSEAERNSFPTLSQLSENDVDNIWANVSAFIDRHMSMQKGVCIAGLGVFTFSQQKLDLGSKYVLYQRPVFILTEKLCQSHGLKQSKPLAAAGDIPVVQLNFTALSVDSPFERDVVEGCVREMLLLLLRAVAAQRSVFLIFRGIGVLSFQHSNVKMKFYRDFISSMDGSGTLLWALSNRPGTSISIISGKHSSLQRLGSCNAMTFPKISSGNVLREEEAEHEGSAPELYDRQEENRKESRLSAQHVFRPSACKAHGNILSDNQETGIPFETTERQSKTSQPPDGAAEKAELKQEAAYPGLACHDHTRAGQELCYLCMQRAQRNVPLYLEEERSRKDKEEEKLLLLAQKHRDEQFFEREQATQEKKLQNNKKMAAINLGVAETLRAKKLAKSSQFEGSYIFGRRPVTPPRLLKQRCYMQDLTEQLTQRKLDHTQRCQNQELTERLHQIQLADEFAKMKSQEFLQKKENMKRLQKALDIQLEHQSPGLPARQPDSDGPVFGVRDGAPDLLAEQKQRAQRVGDEQRNAARSQRKEALCSWLSEQRKERDMLQRNHKELIADRINRYERLRKVRTALEDTWTRSADLKHCRDMEERAFIRSGGRLLIDQCEQYRRCFQCKRKTTNCGESNIWKESHYTSGSRLMV
ncbi:coiled-coil domain-containing protein 81 isoform X1 [Tachysurus fulvidraco]|uniref:coiled-coil domain-containing protein 81 isoform X1 n=1 Tax=Tachysurus fulvidraco TaxID=1234273 RepID=UPI000F4FF1A4|nr:coiled-coil domain-containing protein 81 isoform X1 [Tachysurus fulvidraco]XP_027012264.1 coiled-coil domain-containing protein 81 isoform X1 [Tachysurus fulvidraco]XP_027012265.1 coiled-coil domain-containing protein 81 isoform X1 [Tachysurus fulvidraco]